MRPNSRVESGIVDRLRAEARKTNAEWIDEVAEDVPKRLIEIARSRAETTIALGAATQREPRWLQRPSFARRLLDAGARELLVLTVASAARAQTRLPTNDAAPTPGLEPVEREVEFEHVDARLAEKSERSSVHVRRDERVDRSDAQCRAPSRRAALPSMPPRA